MTKRKNRLLRSLVLLPAAVALLAGWATSASAQLASSPWPMFRHDTSHSGVSPYGDPTPAGTVWSRSIGNGLSSPVIAPDGTIFMGGGSSTLQALSPDGTVKWSQPITSTTRSTPAIGSDGTVYIGSNSRLYAYSSEGAYKWSFTVSGDVTSSPAIGPDGTVYVGSRGGYLYAVTPGTTPVQKWRRSVGDMHMTSPVISADGSTIYTGGGFNLWAIDTSTGNPRWNYPLGVGMTSSAALSPSGSVVYIGVYDGNLYAVKSSDGTLLWQVQVGFKNAATSASPAIGPDGTIYLGSNYGSLYAITPDGQQKWIYEAKTDIRSSVAVNADGTVILASYDGYIHAINSATGLEKWHYLLPGANYASPAIAADGTIVTATMSGVVYGNISGTPPTATPPSDLEITMPSDIQAALTWVDNSSDEYGFRIERRMGTVGPYSVIANLAPGAVTYTDSNLQSGQIYYYRVCAYQAGGNSDYSNEAFVVTPGIQTPAGLVATPVSAAEVTLAWTDRSDDELGFSVERSDGPNGLFEEIARLGVNASAYIDTSVHSGTNYYYRVRAFDADRSSSYSNEAWALTPGNSFTEIRYGDRTRKQMALTFDAGTAAIRTGLLDVLKANNVFSTFFITGYVTEVQKAQVARIGRDGHHLGNHSYDHPDLRYCTDEQIAWQLNVTDSIIHDASGHHTQSYFRAPYGAFDEHLQEAAANAGYRHVTWSGDSGDAGGTTTQQIIDRTNAAAGNGVIMLYHCTVANTEAAIPTVITNLRDQGYELVTVPELIAPKQITSPAGALLAGWNLISVPIEPALPFANIVFRGFQLDGKLFNLNNTIGRAIPYRVATPEAFGNISPDEGYWLKLSAPGSIKIAGSPVTGDRHIRLPAPDENGDSCAVIGYPFETGQEFSNCRVYNPNAAEPKTRPVLEAIEQGWIPNSFFYWDAETQSQYEVSLSEFSPYTTRLEPWRAYSVAWSQGVEFIIPDPTPGVTAP